MQRTGGALDRTGGAIDRTGGALQRTGGALYRTGGAIERYGMERSINVHHLEPAAAHAAGPLISQQDCGCLCAGLECLLYGIVYFEKYVPGAHCGNEYSTMYRKFIRTQKYDFLIFWIFAVQA